MLNTRAFAGCLTFALASLAASAIGAPISIPMVYVENPGNAGISVPQPQLSNTLRPNTGAVADVFKIGKYETTNSQYAAFLNAVDPSGVNPNSIYNSQMSLDAVNGGIDYIPLTGYVAKPGFETKPVTYVNWFSAARFVNWLAGGQQAGSAGLSDMEGGFAGSAYTIPSNQTSGAVVARNTGATFFLPSLDEFYKAAYYTGSGATYTQYATQTNTAPTASTQVSDQSLANVANYGLAQGATTGVVNVGFYTAAQSHYSLYQAYGNVVEFTDTPQPGNANSVMGGGASWRLSSALSQNWSGAQIRYIAASNPADAAGFRVAAVPEPSTLVLAGIGLAGLAGFELRRRRVAG